MSGKTSPAAKNRWNAKAYDRMALLVKKGQKDSIKAHAESMGESLNAFLQRAVSETIERDRIDRAIDRMTEPANKTESE